MPVAAMKDRVLALAGLLQSVRLVQQMANNGQAETRALAPCIDSLFRFDAESTEEVYGSARALDSGLKRVVAQLDGSDRDGAQTRMAMNVLHLERRFVAAPEAMSMVQQRLEEVVGLELLLDRGELDELLGEGIGVQRIQRILVLELCGQERQERIEVVGDAGATAGDRACR